MIDHDFVSLFLDEAAEILDRWEACCLKLETDPSPEQLNALFRSAHNIKGSARSVGLEAFAALVHKAEDLITKLKNGEIPISSDCLGVLLDCQRILVDWVAALRASPETVIDTSAMISKIAGYLSPKAGGKPAEDLAFGFFDEDPTTAGTKASLQAGAQAPKTLGDILVASGQASQEQIEKALNLQQRKIGEILVDQGVVSAEAVKKAIDVQKSQGQKVDETIRVSLKKLDSLIRLIGELSIQHAIVRNAKETGSLNEPMTSEAIQLSHKLIQDLRGEAMSIRMQPLENLFQRMERVSRDVARQQNKSIRVVLKGTDVELDKTVIEKMKDPLVHILRNAVDHGVESAAERQASGKDLTATILIEGIQTASNVSICIIDDGKGLNQERILKKAIEKGLVSPTATPPASEIFKMIFLPGFSTAEKVTDVSGRGVGMDVVKRAADELGGSIDIDSKAGRGTRFQINLPSTLSILDALVVQLGKIQYAVPLQDVTEVIDLAAVDVHSTTSRGRVMNIRGKILPLESLAQYLPQPSEDSEERPRVAVVSRDQSAEVAFVVDRVVGQQSIVVRQLEGSLSRVPGFAGATVLADGAPSMILHLPKIIKSFSDRAS